MFLRWLFLWNAISHVTIPTHGLPCSMRGCYLAAAEPGGPTGSGVAPRRACVRSVYWWLATVLHALLLTALSMVFSVAPSFSYPSWPWRQAFFSRPGFRVYLLTTRMWECGRADVPA